MKKPKAGKKKIMCMSTHGGAGYGFGQSLTIHVYDDPLKNWAEMICPCGYKGKAPPTGGRIITYTRQENFWKWLKGEEKGTVPTWPDWIGKKFVYEN